MTSAQTVQKVAYSIPEFSEITSICRTSVFAEIKAGRLRAVKCGKRTLIPAAALAAWLDSLSAARA
jgi:excisionase family DNA binding protein